MSNKTDFFAGLALLVVCLLFAWQISLLPAGEGTNTFGAGSFPTGIVTLLSVFSLRLLYMGFRPVKAQNQWPEKEILIKIGKMAALIACYVIGFVWFGTFCYEHGYPDGTAFVITTALFLFLAQCQTRPGMPVKSASISAVTTGVLFAAFYCLFKVQLP